jgi:hypothetical protein
MRLGNHNRGRAFSPRPRRVMNARPGRVAWSSLALGAAFAAGALTVGILARPSADVPAVQKPIAMAPVATSPADVVPTRSRKTARTKPGRKLPEEAVAKRETVGFAGVEAAAPSAVAASLQVAPTVPGEAQAQDQTSASTSGEAPRVASDAEQSADGPSAQEAEAAKKAMNEARRAKRLAKRSRWRMAQAQLDANGSQWAYAWPNERQLTFHHRNGRRGTALAGYRVAKPSFFSFLRFGNRNM